MATTKNPLYSATSPDSLQLPLGQDDWAGALEVAADSSQEFLQLGSSLEGAAHTLIKQYAPNPAFFDSTDNVTSFILAAGLKATADKTAELQLGRAQREQRLSAAFSWMVFGSHSSLQPHIYDMPPLEQNNSDRLRIYRSFENTALSKMLDDYFTNSPDIAAIRADLGIEKDQEFPFKPIAINAGGPVHMNGLGVASSRINLEAKSAEWQRNSASIMQRTGAGSTADFPFAWVAPGEDMNFICIPEPAAYALCDPKSVGLHDPTGEIRKNLEHMVQHEYVHTQGNLKLVDLGDTSVSSGLGSLCNEYLAESYSGKHFRSAYSNIYRTADAIRFMTSTTLDAEFRGFERGGSTDRARLYLELTDKLGLIATTMVVGAPPTQYGQRWPVAHKLLESHVTDTNAVINEIKYWGGWPAARRRFAVNGVEVTPQIEANWLVGFEELRNN